MLNIELNLGAWVPKRPHLARNFGLSGSGFTGSEIFTLRTEREMSIPNVDNYSFHWYWKYTCTKSGHARIFKNDERNIAVSQSLFCFMY